MCARELELSVCARVRVWLCAQGEKELEHTDTSSHNLFKARKALVKSSGIHKALAEDVLGPMSEQDRDEYGLVEEPEGLQQALDKLEEEEEAVFAAAAEALDAAQQHLDPSDVRLTRRAAREARA